MAPDCDPDHDRGVRVRPAERAALIAIAAVCAFAAAVLAATAIRPALDIEIVRAALVSPGSLAGVALAHFRVVASFAPLVLCAGLSLTLIARAYRRGRWRSAIAPVAYLALTFALGPGLLVNGVLKTHSHRPRPVQTTEVAAGDAPFRPFYAFDGACARNCSFSSGEAAAAFWTAAPALLAPPPVQVGAVAASLVFGSAVSAARVAAGRHFPSDVAFSALAMLAMAVAGRRLIGRTGGRKA